MASMTGCLETPNSALTSSMEMRDPAGYWPDEETFLELVEDDGSQALTRAAHRLFDHV